MNICLLRCGLAIFAIKCYGVETSDEAMLDHLLEDLIPDDFTFLPDPQRVDESLIFDQEFSEKASDIESPVPVSSADSVRYPTSERLPQYADTTEHSLTSEQDTGVPGAARIPHNHLGRKRKPDGAVIEQMPYAFMLNRGVVRRSKSLDPGLRILVPQALLDHGLDMACVDLIKTDVISRLSESLRNVLKKQCFLTWIVRYLPSEVAKYIAKLVSEQHAECRRLVFKNKLRAHLHKKFPGVMPTTHRSVDILGWIKCVVDSPELGPATIERKKLVYADKEEHEVMKMSDGQFECLLRLLVEDLTPHKPL